VIEPDRLPELEEVCERWEVRATAIGEVTDTHRLVVRDGEEVVGDMPVGALVDECPLYDLEPATPETAVYTQPSRLLGGDAPPEESLLALLASPNIASKRFVFEQYDSVVGSRTVRRPQDADAAVLQLADDGGSGALAVSIDGNGRRVACDPYAGAAEAVLECARNLACVGAEPLGLTNCLNFGNPEKPQIAWQLTRAVRGLRDACLALGVPVVGGNVSLYNEGPEGPIYPTPIVGMVGKLPDPSRAPGIGFREDGLAVGLAGPFRPSLRGSELEKLQGRLADDLPALDLQEQADALAALRATVREGELASVHDVSDGGLAVALAECCIEGGVGARVDLTGLSAEAAEALFGEGPGGFVVSGPREILDGMEGVRIIGETGGEVLSLGTAVGSLSLAVERAREVYERAIPDRIS
jgi:phosphoribosylformylglycinamidine synthase